MKVSIFEKLINKNEFPMLFIGSGISKRYLENFPSWVSLLEHFWNEIGETTDFYGQYNILNSAISKENPRASKIEVEYLTNIKISSLINQKFEEKFNRGSIKIEGFTTKDAHESKINPFKMNVINKFSSYKIKESLTTELNLFKKALLKSQIIITTNYDSFIEDCYNSESNYGVKKYVGQSGFFEETVGYAELYKIHGCVSKPQSIVITEEDYNAYDKNSVLISAKIISMLIHSPIIFLGYSLTDMNVRKYIKDFASSINSDNALALEEKLIVIDWVEGEESLIEEIIYDQELNCKFTYIRTDNYSLIYEYLQKINQGVAPSEIRKYKHIIKEIVIDAGKQGGLKSVLISPLELERIEEILASGGIIEQNLVVALGDSKIIFKTPNKLTYIEDYIFEKDELTTDVVLRFLANSQPKSRYPFKKYLNESAIEESNLHEYEKEKLKQRLATQSDIDVVIKTTANTYKRTYSAFTDIISKNFNEAREISLITFNIKRLNLDEVETYIKIKVNELVETGEGKISSEFRRLMLAYDLLKN